MSLLRLLSMGKLSVFLFHKIPNEVDELLPNELDLARFIQVVDFIETHFEVICLADAAKLISQNRFSGNIAAITFDDGYAEWRQGAAEILAQRSLPATFFITTGQLFGRPMWHERLANIVRHYSGETLDTQAVCLPPLTVGSLGERASALQALDFHFKYLPPVIRDRFLDQLEEKVGVQFSAVPTFSANDLLTIANKGFEIGAHTLDHPILGLCNSDQAQEEIGNSREILEGIIKRPVKGFAYPNGRPWIDFSWRHIDMVKAAGYDYAVTTQWGSARSDTSPYQIPRFTPWGPSRRMMTLQLLRNIFTAPEIIPEVRTT